MKHQQTGSAFPLSPMQQGMLFHSLAAPHSGIDLQQVSLTLPEALDPVAFQRAWQRAVEHHEILRCGFRWHGQTEPLQEIQPEVAVPFRIEHWLGMPRDEQPSALDAWLAADRLREFDLTRPPLWRITLFKFAEAEWQLVWTVHHLLLDAQGISIVLRDVFALYEATQRGEELKLPLRRSFSEHVEHLRQNQNREQAEAFWRERLKGYNVPAMIARATPVEVAANNPGRASLELRLSKNATSALNAFAAAHELSLNTVVQAAWALLLARYAGTRDVVFGVVRNGRRSSIADAETVAGLFINTVPMRVEVRPETPLLPWLKELRANWRALRPFEHTALTDIQTWSELPPGAALFDSLVNFQPQPLDALLGAEGSAWENRHLRILGQPNYPVALDVCGGDSLQLEIVYDAKRFDSALITQVLEYLEALLKMMPARGEGTLADFPLLTNTEGQLLKRWNATDSPYPENKCIHELFEEQTARTPDALAISDECNRATYAELNRRADDIAGCLRSLGIDSGDRVGVWMERSIEMVAAQLGVLKAGGAYLPLDPTAPLGRVTYMLSDAGVKVLLTQSALRATRKIEVPGLKVICLDESLDSIPQVAPARPPAPPEPAYLIYTSGSTGTPKGIEIEHSSVVNLATWHQRTYAVTARDRATLLANPSFDASAWELWPYLTAGASVHIPNDETVHQPTKLASWLRAHSITLTFVPTPLAEALFDEDWTEQCALRAMLTGGDKLNRTPPESFPCPLYNHYGPTECTVVATSALISPSTEGVPPIGRPISNTRIFILDEESRPVPVGVPGELCIGGHGVARGYVNRPELTAEKFIELKANLPERIYRTGDFARWLPSGELEFLGRCDRQVKIRGHRIELGEIEFLLTQHLLVREAAVVSVPDGNGFRLCGFIVPQPDASLTPDALRDFLRQKFSDYMVPTEFSFLEALPLTPNGKRDYTALIKTLPRRVSLSASAGPKSEVEKRLVAIWSEVLEVENVGVQDDFFALGGHSLRAARIVSRVEDAFQCEFPIRDLFEAPTVALMAERLETILSNKKKLRMVIPPPSRNGADAPEHRRPLSFAQERLWFLEQLQPGVPFNNIPVAFRLEGRLDVPALEEAINEIVRRHDVFQSVFKGDAGQPGVQQQSPAPLHVAARDLSELSESERAFKRDLLSREEAKKMFDLESSPLLRATLLRLADDQHLLLLTTHHLVCDGWSMARMRRELSRLYNALVAKQPLPPPAPGISYADFSKRQREQLSDELIETELQFWKRQLADAPAALDLPTDRPRPAVQTYRGATYEISLSPATTTEAVKLSRREGVTLFMVLLSAFQVVLQRYSGQSDIVVGTPTAGRGRVDTDNLVGLLLNTVALRGDLSGNPTFQELLQRTRKVALDAFAHQELPFEKLAEAIQPERDLSRPPLFQVMFALQNGPQQPLELTGLRVTEQHVHSGTAKFDLTLSLEESPTGIKGIIEYNTDLFEEPTIVRLARHFEMLLSSAAAEPKQRISELPLLTRADHYQIAEWNRARTGYPREKCIHELFLEQVARTPDAIALCCGDKELSYLALNERADRLAERLRRRGIGPASRVAICVERSLEMMVSLLGILKAGACYVPLDPNYPAERLAFLLQDSKANLLLTQEWVQERFQFSAAGCDVECVETLLEEQEDIHTQSVGSDVRPRSHNVAYIIYTSGSTGKPKGVMVTHRNVVNFFAGMDRVLGTKPGVWLAVTSISFDISVLELFWTLTRGYKVVIQEEEGHKPLRSRPTSGRPMPKMDFSLFYFASEARTRNEDQYRLLIEGAKFADKNGFSAVWTPERHFHPFGGIFPNPSVISAAVAMITQRIQIRAGSIVLPLHHPVRVAEEWSVVDNLSKGRAAISIASGWHANDFAIAPQNYSKRKAIMIQHMDLIQRLWRGEEVSLPGRAGEPALVRMYPKPIQSELPMWLTSSGNPETFELAGELGANLLTHLSGQDVDSLAAKIEKYRAARRKNARNGGGGRVSLMLHTFVWNDAARVREMVRPPLLDYLRTYRDLTDSAHPHPTLPNPNARNGELNHLLEEATDRYLENCGLFGTPESCLATVEKLRSLGVDEIACLIDFGISAGAVLESLNLLNELRERANRRHSPARRVASQTDGRWRTVADNIVHHGVTHLQCTPSLAGALALVPESLEAMRRLSKLLLGGEALPVDLARRLRAELPGELFNLYGPTETTIWSAAQRVEHVEHCVPIGRPIANTQIHILDANLQPVPVGVPGEMFIGGDGVALGYLNQPELTSQRFVADPFSSDASRRMYRTGDLARWRSDGTIEFLGRSDQQIKLRGHRIELGEIESVLREHAAVTDCALTLVDNAGNQSLVACVVPARESAITATELKRFLESKVPDYMIPANFVLLEKLPLTPNGKLDRKALMRQTGRLAETKEDYIAPQSETEQTIARMWCDLLQVDKVGVNDNFFDLGGHSLLVVQAQARLRAELGVSVPVVRLFQYPTVGRLASFLGNRENNSRLQRVRERGRNQRAAFARRNGMEVVA